MSNHPTSRRAPALENLENRVLFSRLEVGDFGAVPGDGRDDHPAVQRAVDAARPGDTLAFAEGVYHLGHHLRLGTGTSLVGAGERDTTLKFLVGQNGWGIKIDADAKDVTVENFVLDGGGVALVDGSLYRDVTIRDNEFVNTPRGTYNDNGPAVFQAVHSDGLTITGNHVHDTDKYGMILFGVDRLTVSNNTFENLVQAGHILDVGTDNTISFNRLSGMVRMGFELQRHGERFAKNTTVEGNVITDWRTPYRDSFGLSIVPDGSVNTRVINNYIQGVPHDYDGEWNHITTKDTQGRRMGYGIEYGARSGEITGNVVGGAFANHIIVSGGGGKHDGVIDVEQNKLYEEPVWRDYITRESYGGDGFGFSDENNVKHDDFDAMPKPPKTRDLARAGRRGDDDRAGDDDDARPDRTRAFQPGEFTWLSDMDWAAAVNGWGPVETDQSVGERDARDGSTMSLNGRQYERGLGVGINSEVVYELDRKYDRFFSHVGIDDGAGDGGSVSFQVWADGNKVYDSGLMTGATHARALDLSVRGVRKLKLVTTDAGDGGRLDHANWAGAKLTPAEAPAEAPPEAKSK